MKKSNVYSNKFSSVKDILNGLSPVTVVCLIVFTIFIVVGTLAPTINVQHRLTSGLVDYLKTEYFGGTYNYIFAANECDTFTFIIPFIVAIVQFSFLHRKDCCYTLLSFAIKRKKLYTNRVTLPLLSLIATTLIVKGIALGINVRYVGFDTNLLKAWLIHVLIYLQIIFVIYAITVLCCYLCGRTIEATAASLSILLLPFAITFLSKEVFSFSLYGYDGYSETFFSKAFELINPICLEDYGISVSQLPYNLKGRVIASTLWFTVSIVILIVTRRYFEIKYKPEISGFKGAKTGVVYVISLSVPLLFAFFGLELIRSYYYPLINNKVIALSIATTIIMGLVGALLCNFVVHFTFKRFKVALAAGGSIALIIGVISLIGMTGVFCTFNKLPALSEIESASVSCPFSNFIPVNNYSAYLDNYYPSSSFDIYATSEKDLELILDIHQNTLEHRKTESVSRFEVTYTLKNGEIYHREYLYLSESTIEKTLALWESDAAKNIINGQLIPEENAVYGYDDEQKDEPVTVLMENSKIEFASKHNVKTDATPLLTYEQSLELRKAVQKDISVMSAEEWFRPTEKILGEIAFTTYLNQNISLENTLDCSNEFYFSTPVYESMKNTLSVLEKYNLTDLLYKEQSIKKLYVANLCELIDWNQKKFYSHTGVDLTNPYFDSNYIYFTQIEAYPDAPIKEITDSKEIEKYITDGYTQYLIGNNNATYVMVEFEGSTFDEINGAIFIIPEP